MPKCGVPRRGGTEREELKEKVMIIEKEDFGKVRTDDT